MSSPDPPLIRPLTIADPLAAAGALTTLPHPFLFHSALEDRRGRWSFFGADPFATFRDHPGAAIESFRKLAPWARERSEQPGAPFRGGAVGYWSYDYGRRLERLPIRAADDLHLPDFVLGFYDVVGAFDHDTGRAWLFSSGLPLKGRARERRASERLEGFARRIEGVAPRAVATSDAPLGVTGTFTPERYRAAVETVREHIRGGDIFQANLTQRWSVRLPPAVPGPRAWKLARALARLSPAPFGAFLDLGDHAIASASPERFLQLRGRRVEARPIKGTRPRGATASEDERLRQELLSSVKDRAENVMIVDVLRNDLGRVCRPGSVATPELCALESFPQVHHLVSAVTGELSPGIDAFDLLHAAFPGGSITGAPKIRAMEILESLEPVRRHLYTGAIGWLDWGGDAEWSIAIRTALVTADAIHVAAGGGVTADSDPDAEYQETLHKVEGLRQAIESAFGPIALAPGAAHASLSVR